ncbi:MAG: methionyl-tRNA formyltransferase [Candidatus Kryptoniota bacterium]
MKIVFMGTPEFAVPSLQGVVKAGYEIAAVVTNQDERQGRGLNISAPAIKTAAIELGLPVLQVSSLKNADIESQLKKIDPDLMVVVAFRILPKEIFTIPRMGTFNLHASLLPKYRGAAPINWAIINGEQKTGVTTFFLDEKVDTGKIILQKETSIGENETAGEVAQRLSMLGAGLVVETIKLIQQGSVPIIEQDSLLASKAPKIGKQDCLIDWSRPAADVHNFVRGFSPEPGAYTYLNGKILKILGTRLTGDRSNPETGAIKTDSGKLLVSCADNCIEILELQLEGKKKLMAADFLRGARLDFNYPLGGLRK